MPVTINNNVVSGPEEQHIPAHLSFGQFMFDQLKNGGDKVALVSIPYYLAPVLDLIKGEPCLTYHCLASVMRPT